MAPDELMETASAVNAMAPPEERSRSVVERALSFATVTAMESPTPVPSDSVLPVAVLVTWLVRAAAAAKFPVATMGLPAPTVVCVSLFEMEMATTGVTAVEPLAPFFAVVVMAWDEVAPRVRACAPTSVTPPSISAAVVFSL